MLFMSITLNVQLHLTKSFMFNYPFDNLHKKYVDFKAALSVTFDILILEIKFLLFKNTVKILKFR